MRPPPDPAWQPPEAILTRIADELQRCQALLHGLETAVAPLMAAAPAAGNSHALQDIDRLGQMLGDLATCVEGLASDLGGAPALDARRLLAGLRLDDVAQRLGGQAPLAAPAEARVALF